MISQTHSLSVTIRLRHRYEKRSILTLIWTTIRIFQHLSSKGFEQVVTNQIIKTLFLIIPVVLLLVPLVYADQVLTKYANASSQSSFDNKFKKCFDAAPAPDFIKMGLPWKTWEAIYKDYVGNLTNPVLINVSTSIISFLFIPRDSTILNNSRNDGR
jgi:hypothetical protein